MKKWFILPIIVVLTQFLFPSQTFALSSCAKTFQDLKNTDAQYIPAIGCLNQKYCVVQGTQDGYLNASTPITRGEAVALITRFHIEVLQDDWKNVNVSSLPQYFSDVPPSYALYKEIEIARNKGFILGTTDGKFNPNNPWTAGYQGPNRADYNFSLVPADQQTRGGFLKSMYDKSPQYCQAPTLCNDQNTGTPPRPRGMCSSNAGCKKAQPYYSSTPDCNSPIQQPIYDTDPACGPIPATSTNPNPDNSACPAIPVPTKTPTPTPIPPTATPTPVPPTLTPAPSDGTTCTDLPLAKGFVKMAYTPVQSGSYTVWTRMIGPSVNTNVIVQVGDQCNVIVGGAGINTSAWQWVNYKNGDTNKKFTVTLQEGKTYTVHVGGGNTSSRVDVIKFDNTGCAQLEGIDGHCAPVVTPTPSTPIPTATPTATLTPIAIPTNTPAPTSTPVPTNTPVPNATRLDMQFILHAIGAGGDNSSPNGGGGNPNPIDTQRDVIVQVYNTANQLVIEKSGKIQYYNPQIGIPELIVGGFHGIIDLGSSISTGDYIIKVKTPFYLRKQFSTTKHIRAGEVTEVSAITLVAGDIDNNNQLDLFDYQILSACYGDFTTPDPAKCSTVQKHAADINNDGSVNYIDLNYFIRELAVQAGDIQ